MARADFGAHLFRLLDQSGDGSGADSWNLNHSAAPQAYFIRPPRGETYTLHRMIVTMQMGGVWTADSFGSGAKLTNGIGCHLRRDGVDELDIFDGRTVKTNGGWGALCYDVDLKSWGNGDSFLVIRWTFAKSGSPIILNGNEGEEIAMYVNDDISAFTEAVFFVQGYRNVGL